MNQIAAHIPADDALFDDVVRAAEAARMNLIYNGQRIVACSTVPPGWKKLDIKITDRDTARLEATPCAA